MKPVKYAGAMWALLQSHRGEMYCTACIALALGATRRIDRALIAAEGRGALRRYGECWKCGNSRLLSGFP